MADTTGIEWCDSTFNPWIGCTKVSPGCDHCYAEVSTPSRTMKIVWGAGQERHRTSVETWKQPARWDRHHVEFFAQHGRRRRVFCASLADWLDNQVSAAWRSDLLGVIRLTPHLDWLLLTKRIGNWKALLIEASLYARGENRDALADWIDAWLGGRAPHNVWVGTSIVNREEMLREAPKQYTVPAKVHFWSVEPMLGDLGPITLGGMPDWIICGGESGPQARPMHPDWARNVRDWCAAAGVQFLFKQWGEWLPSEAEDQPVYKGEHRYLGDGAHAYRIGKKAAGRLLDGVEHNGMPEVPNA